MINFICNIFQSPLIATIAAISIIIYFYFNRNLNYWNKLGISGPKPITLFGNFHSYFIKSQPEVEVEWYQKYGKIFGIYIGNSPVFQLSEPELLKQILIKDFHKFRNRRDPPTRHPIISKIVVFSRDDDWKRIRSVVTPTFSSAKLKKLYSLINQCCAQFMDSLDEYAKNGKQIDLKSMHGTYTLDVIAKCAFASNINSYKNPNNIFMKNVYKIYNVENWKQFLYFLVPNYVARSHIVRKLFVNSKSGEFFVDLAKHLIIERKQSKSDVKYDDFLQLLLDTDNSDTYQTNHIPTAYLLNEGNNEIESNDHKLSNENHTKSSEKKLSENELLAQFMAFILAGYETTAMTPSFCSLELALHPEIQQKLYEEINTAFDDKGNIDYDTLHKLHYLDAVVSETLRRYPAALRLERKAMEDVVLGDTGITIPKGMISEVPIYSIHHDPQNFPNPYQFNPERFLPENLSSIKPFTYLPFGTGPRMCLGMRFALIEMKVALVYILKRFTLSKTSNTVNTVQYRTGRFLLQNVQPIIVAINRR